MSRHCTDSSLRPALLVALLLFLALAAGACANAIQEPETVPDVDQEPDPSVRFLSGVQQWGGSVVAWNDSLYDLVAEYDLFSYMSLPMYSDPRCEGLVDELRLRNPDIRVGAYFLAHGVRDWQFTDLMEGKEHLGTARAAFAMDHLAQTVTGDTARAFNNIYMMNITEPGVVEGMVEFLRVWRDGSDNNRSNMFLMLDHCSVPHHSWLSGRYAQETEGDLDLDGDGVGHLDDPDEQQALRDAYVRLVDELHRVLPDMKVVVNGNLVRLDREFRSRVDGMYIEGGFRWGWGDRYFDTALLEPGERNLASMLADMRNGGFSIYEWKEDYRVGWAVSMFYDNVVPLMAPGHDSLPFVLQPHPGEWNVGRPLGPAVVVDGILQREFEHGTATLETILGRTPYGFRFRLTDDRRSTLITFNEGS